MGLRTYFAILKRRKWIIILTAVITTVLVTAVTFLQTPKYEASTMLRVATVSSGSDYIVTDIGYTERLMNTYIQIATSGSTRRELKAQLGMNALPDIKVDLIPNTELMFIRAEEADPDLSRDLANAAAALIVARSKEVYSVNGQTAQEILKDQLDLIETELADARAEYESLVKNTPDDVVGIAAADQTLALKERTHSTLLQQYDSAQLNEALRANAVSVVEPAITPTQPSQPRPVVNIVLGLVVGTMAGVALAFLLENLDTTLYTTEQIETAAELATVGKIPEAKDDLGIARLGNGHYPQLEAFRRLRTNIMALEETTGPKIVLATSAQRSEGKSTVTANLAVTIAQSGRKVIVIDCDMRLPMVHKIFDLPNKRGLTSVLTKDVALEDAILYTTYPRVQVLTSGPLPPNPTELLGSDQMTELVEELKEQYDYVLLDTPALLSVADAAVLAPKADSVVIIVAQAKTRREDIQMVRKQLSNVKANSIGIVVNHAKLDESYSSYGQLVE